MIPGIPVSFKIPRISNRVDIHEWLTENGMLERVTYDWATGLFSFGDNEDATAFALKFNVRPYETKIDKLIKEVYEKGLN